jgi:hypothetical protein
MDDYRTFCASGEAKKLALNQDPVLNRAQLRPGLEISF